MQQSYLVAEGSFVGRFSNLSIAEEGTDGPSALWRLFSREKLQLKKHLALPSSPFPSSNQSNVVWNVGDNEVEDIYVESGLICGEVMEDGEDINEEVMDCDEVVLKDGKKCCGYF